MERTGADRAGGGRLDCRALDAGPVGDDPEFGRVIAGVRARRRDLNGVVIATGELRRWDPDKNTRVRKVAFYAHSLSKSPTHPLGSRNTKRVKRGDKLAMTSSVSSDFGSFPLRSARVTIFPAVGSHSIVKAAPAVNTALARGCEIGFAWSVDVACPASAARVRVEKSAMTAVTKYVVERMMAVVRPE